MEAFDIGYIVGRILGIIIIIYLGYRIGYWFVGLFKKKKSARKNSQLSRS